jgi:hypothetical protein
VLTIDTLSLRLPAGFESRAEPIGRLLADALARIEIPASLHVEHLALPAIEVSRHASDADVVARITDAVRQRITVSRRGAEL